MVPGLAAGSVSIAALLAALMQPSGQPPRGALPAGEGASIVVQAPPGDPRPSAPGPRQP